MQIGPAVLPGHKTSQTDRQTDRRHAVPKARPIVRSAKNVQRKSFSLLRCPFIACFRITSVKLSNMDASQGCARGLFSRDRGETETLKPGNEALTIQAETRPSGLETEMRPRRTNSDARPSRGTTGTRDGLETEASRPRPRPTSTSFRGLM